jgi:tungstate transport system ATP-binding protein
MSKDSSKVLSVASIEAKNLSVVLGGHKIIDIPSFSVFPNEVLVVIGPNGSGKTTLLLTLATLLKPEKKAIIAYWGQPVKYTSDILKLRRQFAVLFQEPLLLSGNVWDNVTLGLRLRGIKKDEIILRAKKWMERFGILGLAKRQIKTLSGGEAKRVSLARAFVLQPQILFLDEPFTALDSPTRAALLDDFESVLRETRVTTVMVTHDHNEALILADRVAVLIAGQLRQIGKPNDIFNYPVDEEVASFVEIGNILNGTVSQQNSGIATVAIGSGQIEVVSPVLAGTRVTACLRFEDISLSIPGNSDTVTSARNQQKGIITRVLPLAAQVKVILDCGFPLTALISKRSYEEMGLMAGQEIIAAFKASVIHLIPHK